MSKFSRNDYPMAPEWVLEKSQTSKITLKNHAHLNRGGHDCGRSFANEAENIAEEAAVSLILWHLV